MLRAKDDAVKKLRELNPAAASEDALEALHKALADKEREIQMMQMTIAQLEKGSVDANEKEVRILFDFFLYQNIHVGYRLQLVNEAFIISMI